LLPKLTGEELQVLATDIKERGLIHEIVLYEGKILDGRNRYEACKIAGVQPRFKDWKGKGSPLGWVISTNLVRRHLTASQRAVIAHDLLPMLENEAKARQRLSKGRGKKGCEKVATLSGTGRAAELAAHITNSNYRYVDLVKRINHQAPELVPKVKAGMLRIGDAQRLSALNASLRKQVLRRLIQPATRNEVQDLIKKVRADSRQRAAKRFASKNVTSKEQGILTGDMNVLSKRLDNDSVDLFLTDPPYAEVELYGRLAELASAKLKPGGLCLAYSGQFHLFEVMEAMSHHLTYWWTFAIQFSGSHCAIHPRRIQNKWKPILAFARPPITPANEWLVDSLKGGGRDKAHHDWGQAESEVEYLLRHLTEAGDLVVDPYCGGGSVPSACKRQGRRWLATEIDKSTAQIARKRLADAS